MKTDAFVQTYTGNKIFLNKIKSDDIQMFDIARGLSMKCRFSGQIVDFYSVAEHSVNVATLVAIAGGNSYEQLAALLHDAHEFITPDIPTPIKAVMGRNNKVFQIQDRVDEILSKRYKLGRLMKSPLVKEADLKMLYTEKAYLFKHQIKWAHSDIIAPADDIVIYCYNPGKAEARFLDVFRAVTNEIKNASTQNA